MFEWFIRYCDIQGVHNSVVAASSRAGALRTLNVPPGCVLDVRRRWGLRLYFERLHTRSPPIKLQLLLLTQISALLASGESSRFNQVLQSLPALRRFSARYPDVLRDDFSLSEKLASLHCADEVVISIAAGEKTDTLPAALQDAIDHLRQTIVVRESSFGTLLLGLVLFFVSLTVFFALPSFLQEPLRMLVEAEGIEVQATPATSVLLGINRLTEHGVLLLLGFAALSLVLWFFRASIKHWPPFSLVGRWRNIRRSLRFLGAWRPMRLANVSLQTCPSIFTRALGASCAGDFFERLRNGESLSTILQAEYFSPLLALSNRGLVEADDKTFAHTVDVLISVLLEEQRSLSKRLAAFFYTAGIVFTIGVVMMVTFGLIFPILGATVAL